MKFSSANLQAVTRVMAIVACLGSVTALPAQPSFNPYSEQQAQPPTQGFAAINGLALNPEQAEARAQQWWARADQYLQQRQQQPSALERMSQAIGIQPNPQVGYTPWRTRPNANPTASQAGINEERDRQWWAWAQQQLKQQQQPSALERMRQAIGIQPKPQVGYTPWRTRPNSNPTGASSQPEMGNPYGNTGINVGNYFGN